MKLKTLPLSTHKRNLSLNGMLSMWLTPAMKPKWWQIYVHNGNVYIFNSILTNNNCAYSWDTMECFDLYLHYRKIQSSLQVYPSPHYLFILLFGEWIQGLFMLCKCCALNYTPSPQFIIFESIKIYSFRYFDICWYMWSSCYIVSKSLK
jgi:hypothetical protein